jgi:Zn-dependent protease
MPIVFVTILILIFSVVLHEIAHGWMANYLGDPTAKQANRLTLNPIKHLDPVGSVVLPLILFLMHSNIMFGWAKPVPINPYFFRDKKYGEAKTAIAGPLANISIAIFFGLLIKFLPLLPLNNSLFVENLIIIFSYIIWINLVLAIFNLIPIPPLDGSHIIFSFLPESFNNIKYFFMQYGFVFFVLFIFYFVQYIVPLIEFAFFLIVGQPFLAS